jgi:hypothetical protein
VNELLEAFSRVHFQRHLAACGICPGCGHDTDGLAREDFDNEMSWRVWRISGLCPACQDVDFARDGTA